MTKFGKRKDGRVYPKSSTQHVGEHHKAHKHEWMPYMLGAQVCSRCGINRASVGYRYKGNREYDAMVENRLKAAYYRTKELEDSGILKRGASERLGKRLDEYQNGHY